MTVEDPHRTVGSLNHITGMKKDFPESKQIVPMVWVFFFVPRTFDGVHFRLVLFHLHF